MKVICLETKAFYELVDEVVERMIEQKREASMAFCWGGYGNAKNHFQNNFAKA